MPDAGRNAGVVPGVLKAVSGSLGALPVRVFTHAVYDDLGSIQAGQEVKKELVMVGIKNDRFTECCIAEQDLDMQQRIELAPLLERFRTQKDSTETAIENWDAISEQEKAFLLKMGIQFVEQMAAYPDSMVGRMGKVGIALKEKAVRHMTGKAKRAEQEEQLQELALIREERERDARRLQELEEKYHALLAAQSAQAGRRGRDNAQAAQG